MALDWKNAYAGIQARGEAAYPPAGLHYLLQVCRQASTRTEGRPLTPEELVKNFHQAARRDFGSLKNRVLEDWSLRSAEDLGKAVVLLGSCDCLLLEPTDTVEAFAALENQL